MNGFIGFLLTVLIFVIVISAIIYAIYKVYTEIALVGIPLRALIWAVILLSIIQTILSGFGIMDLLRNISRVMFISRAFFFSKRYKVHLYYEGASLLWFPIKWFVTGIGFSYTHYLLSIPISLVVVLIIIYDDTQFIYDDVELEKDIRAKSVNVNRYKQKEKEENKYIARSNKINKEGNENNGKWFNKGYWM